MPYGGIRWVKPETIHITLKFCGEIPEEMARAVSSLLDKELPRGPFELAARGVAKERKKFSPHITLGRRSETTPLPADALRELTFDEISLPSWTVREVIFMRSELTPKGPIYTPLKIYEL